MQPSVKRAWPIMAALVVCCRAGTDGAMGLFYEQQLTIGSLENWPLLTCSRLFSTSTHT